ncbi:MAG: hypoxanthine phosphoribosyltransferase [Chitinophagia bacterium]|jgi:hypoxanthine phosphoribosyltransferase
MSATEKVITVHDKKFMPFIEPATLQKRIHEIATQLNADFKNKQPLFLAILNGSFMFAADIFRQIELEAEICFVKLSSYEGTKSSGKVISYMGLDVDITNRHIILLEDIIDTGRTLSTFLPQLQEKKPASLSIATLLHKPEAALFPISIQYCGFTIPNLFVLGYGLDYNGLGRNLPGLYQLTT